MNLVYRDDLNPSETESEYFSGTDESDESFSEVSDPLYEGDTESNIFDEQELISESSIDDIIDDCFLDLRRDCNSDDSENEFEINKEDGSDAEVVLEELIEYIEGSENEDFDDSFDDSDSDYDEEFISFIIRNTKYQLQKMMIALTPMVMRKF